jgi:hypothetical protein
MNILNAFITKQTGHLNSAESKCLNLTAYIIKVILVGCFSANDAMGLSTNLIRKISSTMQDDEDDNDIIEFKRKTTEE